MNKEDIKNLTFNRLKKETFLLKDENKLLKN